MIATEAVASLRRMADEIVADAARSGELQTLRAAAAFLDEQRLEIERLRRIVHEPDPHNFSLATETEMRFQRTKWGDVGEGSTHEHRKAPIDWFWLVVYLAAGALFTRPHEDGLLFPWTEMDNVALNAIRRAHQAKGEGPIEKQLHRIIATAAACGNWHAGVLEYAAVKR